MTKAEQDACREAFERPAKLAEWMVGGRTASFQRWGKAYLAARAFDLEGNAWCRLIERLGNSPNAQGET